MIIAGNISGGTGTGPLTASTALLQILAGTLQGVYRSTDGGATWTLISPSGSTEIHEVESLAVDPANPDIVYAGTWHLPWKTTDGGATWTSIKDGIIEDSDVFSILIAPRQPNVVYLSACSGIYKSVDGGAKFTASLKLTQSEADSIGADLLRSAGIPTTGTGAVKQGQSAYDAMDVFLKAARDRGTLTRQDLATDSATALEAQISFRDVEVELAAGLKNSTASTKASHAQYLTNGIWKDWKECG